LGLRQVFAALPDTPPLFPPLLGAIKACSPVLNLSRLFGATSRRRFVPDSPPPLTPPRSDSVVLPAYQELGCPLRQVRTPQPRISGHILPLTAVTGVRWKSHQATTGGGGNFLAQSGRWDPRGRAGRKDLTPSASTDPKPARQAVFVAAPEDAPRLVYKRDGRTALAWTIRHHLQAAARTPSRFLSRALPATAADHQG
jgi:hypothetical protein